MAIQSVPYISPAPVPGPQRGDQNTFDDRMDASIRWQEIAPDEFNALGDNVNNNANEALTSANSASAASVSAQVSASTAIAKAATASAAAVQATNSAQSAAESAASASAVTGIPPVTGNATKSLRVNANGTAMEWVQDGAALGYTPVQQGTGLGQDTVAVKLGRGTGTISLKATVGDNDLGYVAMSSTDPTIAISAPRFNGSAAGLTGFSATQITTALGFTPVDKSGLMPGSALDAGRYIDMHHTDLSNDYDARISISAPTGGNGSSALGLESPLVYLGTAGGSAFAPNLVAETFQGDGNRIFLGDESLQSRFQGFGASYGRLSLAEMPGLSRVVDGYRYDTRPFVDVVSFGSSVPKGATLNDPSTEAPGAVFTQMARDYFDPAGTLNFRHTNFAVDGSIATDFPTAWAAMISAGINPTIVYLAYGMNDQAVAQWNSGQTANGFDQAIVTAVALIRKTTRADIVLVTTPHAAVVNNPNLFSMPPSVPQNYPTPVAAPVGPEQISPPASQSYAVGDFADTGTSISCSKRGLWINRKMRALASRLGCLISDAEYFWLRGLAIDVRDGLTMAQAEARRFNPGETVHPNLFGHQQSYGLASKAFWQSVGRTVAQGGGQRDYYGSVSVNPDNDSAIPAAAFSTRTAYPDMVTPSYIGYARSGVPDANGIRANEEAIKILPNGDIVQGNIAATGGEVRTHRELAVNNTLTSFIRRQWAAYGVVFTETVEGSPNVSPGSPYNTRAPFPDNAVGKSLIITGRSTGINAGVFQVTRYTWTTLNGTLTLSSPNTQGAGVFTVSVNGLGLTITPAVANTNFTVHWESMNS